MAACPHHPARSPANRMTSETLSVVHRRSDAHVILIAVLLVVVLLVEDEAVYLFERSAILQLHAPPPPNG